FECRVEKLGEKLTIKGLFKNNHYFGEIKINSSSLEGSLIGAFNELGWADGEWVIERKKDIPIKQIRQYYKGFLLSVYELDYSTGENNKIFALQQNEINDIKQTLDSINNTVLVSNIHYKRIQDFPSHNDINSRFYWSGNDRSLKKIFASTDFLSGFIPYKNRGVFAKMEKDHEWYEQKRKEKDSLILLEKKEKIKEENTYTQKKEKELTMLL